MPQPVFAKLKARALKEQKSIQGKLMEYIEAGLEVDDDWEADWPDHETPTETAT